MYQDGNTFADGGALGPIFWLVFLGVYFYFAFAQFKIAQKVGLQNQAWWSFIPILNLFLLVKCAGRKWYWFLFLFIPVFNIVAALLLWLDIAKRVQVNAIWAVLTLLPFLNFIAVGVMAFASPPAVRSFTPGESAPTQQPTQVG